jgi:hypothetical protein
MMTEKQKERAAQLGALVLGAFVVLSLERVYDRTTPPPSQVVPVVECEAQKVTIQQDMLAARATEVRAWCGASQCIADRLSEDESIRTAYIRAIEACGLDEEPPSRGGR